MDWATILGGVLTGGVGAAVVNQLVSGWRQRSRARGRQDSLLDALRRSRLWWMEHTYRARRTVIEAGGQLPPFDESGDPYLAWSDKDHVPADGKD